MNPPQLRSTPTGSLTASATTDRVRTVTYSASDVGGGLYRQRLLSDGVEVASAPIDENGGRCVRYPVGNGFVSPVPCKLSASTGMSLDTAALADGPHQITLEVFDATNENKATAIWPVVVDNVPPVTDAAGGGAASKAAGLGAPGKTPLAPLTRCATSKVVLSDAPRSLPRSYRRSGLTLAGRLTAIPNGRGLGATSLDVMQTVTRAGTSRRTTIASGRTSSRGSFAIKVPVGPTRVLELRDPACGAVGPKVVQRVRGAIAARTTTRRVRNGQTARIRGSVLGGYLGRGLPLELQVKVGATWRDVKAVTTDARGHFRVAYRFRRTFVRYTYRFRMISRGGSAWPYLRATSAQIRVRVN